jgi:hypothetical protein
MIQTVPLTNAESARDRPHLAAIQRKIARMV